MENDFTFVYGLVASTMLVILALFLAKQFKSEAKENPEKKKREKEAEIFRLAKDEDLTAEEKERLIAVLSKKL